MTRYIMLYLAPHTVAERFAQATPAEAQKGLQLWIDWQQKLGAQLLDPGRPLGNAHIVSATGVSASETQIIGMSIVQAGSMDEAIELAKQHHHLKWAENCQIQVLEEMPIPELMDHP